MALFVLGPFLCVIAVLSRASEQVNKGFPHGCGVLALFGFRLGSFQNRGLHVMRDFAFLHNLMAARVDLGD